MAQRTNWTRVELEQIMDSQGIAAQIGFPPGAIWYVHNTGDSTNSGKSRDSAVATIAQAIAKASANMGHVIYAMPGHTETLSATTVGVAVDKAGIAILGGGFGKSRPVITCGAGAVAGFNVTAANVTLRNLWIVGNTSCTAFVNTTAAQLSIEKCVFEHPATPLLGVTIQAGGNQFTMDGCKFFGTADGPDVAVDFVGHVADAVIRNTLFNYGRNGCDLGVIRANDKALEQPFIDNCQFIGCDTVAIDFNSSTAAGANAEGLCSYCDVGMGADTANIDTAIDAGGCGLIQCMGTDNPDSSGSRIPVQTPA